jgi:NMD protein affecting ribosome stability and mRNA decay
MNSIFGRKDRLVQEREHDAYRSRTKLQDPAICQECGAVYLKGRWVWKSAPEGANKTTCPACRRIADKFPVGYINIKGRFYADHHDEILNLVKNVEKKEMGNHPMERIMAVEELPEGACITTTGIHVARGIGSALSTAYHGKKTVMYLDGENCVRVNWTR